MSSDTSNKLSMTTEDDKRLVVLEWSQIGYASDECFTTNDGFYQSLSASTLKRINEELRKDGLIDEIILGIAGGYMDIGDSAARVWSQQVISKIHVLVNMPLVVDPHDIYANTPSAALELAQGFFSEGNGVIDWKGDWDFSNDYPPDDSTIASILESTQPNRRSNSP